MNLKEVNFCEIYGCERVSYRCKTPAFFQDVGVWVISINWNLTTNAYKEEAIKIEDGILMMQ